MPSPSPDRPGGGPIRSRRSNSRTLSVATIAAEGFFVFSSWHDDDDLAEKIGLADFEMDEFRLINASGTYERRDGVADNKRRSTTSSRP